jgi:CRP/FNR family cyclic AMP-dependent transcriptional regulator
MSELTFQKNEVICRQGENSSDLMFLKEGKLLICAVHGTQVKTIGRIGPGEFIGELSFFDGTHRAANIVALETSVLSVIPREEIIEHLPFWFVEAGKNLTKKIRLLDDVIQKTNLRKASTEDQKGLSIEDQRLILAAINKKD